MNKGKNDNETPPDPLDELGVPSDPNLLMTDYMDNWRIQFQNDPSNIIPALFGVAAIASYYWQHPEESDPDNVEVPFWVIEAISEGFMNYHNAKKSGRTTTLGEAFGLEGGGQGVQPKLKTKFKSNRDRKIALAIELKVKNGASVEDAINDVAEQYDRSAETIWLIWSTHKELAKSSIENFLTLKTSGSDESD